MNELRKLSPGEAGCYQGASDIALITEIKIGDEDADMIVDGTQIQIFIAGYGLEDEEPRNWLFDGDGKGLDAAGIMSHFIMALNDSTGVTLQQLRAHGWTQIY